MCLAAAALIAASIWLLEPISLQLLCVVVCAGVFYAMLFALNRRVILVAASVIAIVLSVAATHWPLRAAFFNVTLGFGSGGK
jgi:hypothetical protein